MFALVFNLGFWISTNCLEQRTEETLAKVLSSLVSTSESALRYWVNNELATLNTFTENRPYLPKILSQLPSRAEQQLTEAEFNALQLPFEGLARNKNLVDYWLLDSHFKPLLSRSNDADKLAQFRQWLTPELMAKLHRGDDLFLHQLEGNDLDSPLVFIAHRLLNSEQQLGGYILFQLNPKVHFTQVLQLNNYARSGDSFAFNADGQTLSQNRQYQSEPLNLIDRLLQPNVDKVDVSPFLRPCHQQLPGVNTDGYLNQQGKLVVGAWIWSPTLNLGVATEMAYTEAFAVLHDTKTVLIASQIVTNLMLLLFAYTNWRHQRRLRQISMEDDLTGIANRRAFDQWFTTALANRRRHSEPLTLMLLDVDKFKPYNDEFGHTKGDAALKQIASALDNALPRSTDLVARYGGEEFVVALQYTNSQQAEVVAQHLLQAVAQLDLCASSQAALANVTISIGIFCYDNDSSYSVDDLMEFADKALYRAKALGGNRAEHYVTYRQS